MSEIPPVLKGYTLHELIGSGGIGKVYRAHQDVIERDVAIKIIRSDLTNQPTFVHRFQIEAQTIARLEHPHIVPLYDYWRDPNGAYLVMRWIKEGSLRQSLQQRGRWSLEQTLRLAEQIGEALIFAHQRGIVHRDIKPENILLDAANNAYLTDFGIAVNLERPSDTDAELLAYGSPAYTAPEQFTKKLITTQADIYSFGIMLFEMLAGRSPFGGTNTQEILEAAFFSSIPSIRQFVPTYSPLLDQVLTRATEMQLDERYTHIEALLDDLRHAAGYAPRSKPVPPSAPPAPPADIGEFGGLDTLQLDAMVAAAQAHPVETGVITADLSGGAMPPPTESPLEGVQTTNLTTFRTRNPYKGLKPFTEADSSDFFGRSDTLKRLFDLLDDMSDQTPRCLALVGASGSGKSSVVRAGLIPELRRGAIALSQHWFIASMLPSSKPLQALAEALNNIAIYEQPDLLTVLQTRPDGLSEAVARLLPPQSTLLLFIDQFEELFTLTTDEAERAQYLALLHDAAHSQAAQIYVVFTLRADFYDRPLSYPQFAEMMRAHTEVILPLSASELIEVIEEPALNVGLRLEPNLSALIVADVNRQANALPLMQFVLSELAERQENGLLTLRAYEALGGVSGALALRAEEVFEGLSAAHQRLAQGLFLRLVMLNEQAQPTRQRTSQPELLTAFSEQRSSAQAILDAFGEQRLLVYDRDPHTRLPTVEIAHEALLLTWERLGGWIASARDIIGTHQRMVLALQEWRANGQDASFLAAGARLLDFERLKETPVLRLSANETAYLDASLRQRKRQQQQRRLVIAALTGITVLALIFAGFAAWQGQRANREARLSRSRELAALSQANVTTQTDTALLNSLDALQIADTYEARNSLLRALEQHPFLGAYLPQRAPVRSVALSQDGAWLVAALNDNTLQRWQLNPIAPLGEPLVGHSAQIQAVAVAQNGAVMASADGSGAVILWDALTGEPLFTLPHESAVWALSFHPLRAELLTATQDGTLSRWSVQRGTLIADWQAHAGIIYSAQYSPDGAIIASGGDDLTLRLWDTATGEPLPDAPPAEHPNWVLSVAFSPNGRVVASAGVDGDIYFWDTTNGERLLQIDTPHTNWIRHITFNNTGQYLLTSGQDGISLLWDTVTSNLALNPLRAHTDALRGAAFLPNSTQFITAGLDGRILLWDTTRASALINRQTRTRADLFTLVPVPNSDAVIVSGGVARNQPEDYTLRWLDAISGEEQRALAGHLAPVLGMRLSPSGTWLASYGMDAVSVWNVESGSLVFTQPRPDTDKLQPMSFLPTSEDLLYLDERALWRWQPSDGSSAQVITLPDDLPDLYSMALSADGARVALGHRDGQITLWSLRNPAAPTLRLSGHSAEVTALSFTPNGETLLSASRDQSVRLWDAHSGVGQILGSHSDWVLALAVHPQGRYFVTGGQDGQMIWWDIAQRQMLGLPQRAHSGWVASLAFNPSGTRLYSAGTEGDIVHWLAHPSAWQRRACTMLNRPTDALPSVCAG